MARLHTLPVSARAPRRLIFYPGNRRERTLALAVSGAVEHTDTQAITFPPEPFVVADLQLALDDDLTLSPDVEAWFSNQIEIYKRRVAFTTMTDTPCSAPWASKLYPYQRVGAEWLRLSRRGILGDDMGLGKTLQALTAAREARRRIIVTVPMAERSVWQVHIERWLGEPALVLDGTGTRRAALLREFAAEPRLNLIINHEMLQYNRYRYTYAPLWEQRWDVAILDEAHKFQGRAAHTLSDGTIKGSQQSLGASKLKVGALYLLTGTPVWNRPESIFQLLRLLEPLRFTSYWRFVEEYCQVDITEWSRTIVGLKADAAERLQSLLAPYVLRRKKAVVLPQLPDKQVQLVEYSLSPGQRASYQALKKEYRLLDPDGGLLRVEPSIPKTFADMRRLLNAPVLVDPVLAHRSSDKDALVDALLEQALSEERKVVIFVWHTDYARYLAARLHNFQGTGTSVALITGDTPARQREVALEQFNDPTRVHHCDILVASIAATGVAIDLTAASVAIFAEGAYVPTQVRQAEDRLHRIGQKTDVMIYRLAARNTIEAAIWQVVDAREADSDEMLTFRAVAQRVLAQKDNDDDNDERSVDAS